MPSKEAEFINELFKNALKEEGKGYEQEREEGRKRAKRELPEGMTLKELELNGCYAELIEKPGNNGPLVIYIHGGGFKTGDARERREITFEIAKEYGSNVISVNYRLAPENKWPAQLEDCVGIYKEILSMGYDPADLVLMGESAGGSLVVATILYLLDNNMPIPKAGVVYSCSINHGGHFRSHFDNIATDYMLGDAVSRDDDIPELYGEGLRGIEESKSRYASPYAADFTGFPPIFIAVSDSEALYDDSVILYDRLQEAHVYSKLHVGHDLIHAYPIFHTLPESIETMKETFEFIASIDQRKQKK
ncbi:alpha/beta hydrolase [Butyrivibrio sp. MC2013]|uniref:alpha/beta hydrolase n=1 Tax=Butyrivibrio sp. MC2013 TaxID=1280686 RepID=UPI0018CA3AF7|nr:alpha/beta hydrolase [Butyrivibrio sp. MC2013]